MVRVRIKCKYTNRGVNLHHFLTVVDGVYRVRDRIRVNMNSESF